MLPLPIGSEVLHVEVQHDVPRLWVLVFPEAPVEPVEFVLVGTGHPVPQEVSKHVGSFLIQNDRLVFHLFEV
jgi:hypothetical protein